MGGRGRRERERGKEEGRVGWQSFITSVKVIKNEIRCRDDTVPKTEEATATPKNEM